MYLALYILVFAALLSHAPDALFRPGTREFVIILGIIGLWRYSWGGVHLVRSLIYRHRVYPRWRSEAYELVYGTPDLPADLAEGRRPPGTNGRAAEVFILVTSFRIPAEVTAHVYRAAIEEAVRYGVRVTIIAAIVEQADQRFIKQIFKRAAPPDHVRLVLVRTGARGKRHSMACALRALSRCRPDPDAAVVFMDGDTLLAPNTLARCVPFFELMPDVAGITTDEDCVVQGGRAIVAWHRLRFAHRHMLMSSMGLSRRLLTMTGRMSLFRVGVVTDPSFVEAIANDHLDHWRLGRLRLLTGEDKSTWFWMLERGLRMVYVPDVRIVTIEHPPDPSFVRASTMLMMRWFGNMLRASGRAIALGPKRVGAFTWWCLVDQRMSMWTPLLGPIACVSFTLGQSVWFLYTYLLWVMATRLIQSLLLLTQRAGISGLYPPLLYYSQVYGALIKSYVLFRLDQQRWTRQNITLDLDMSPWRVRLRRFGSLYLHGLALATVATVVAFWTGALRLP